MINDNWYLVDLPGYGYAKVSKKTKSIFQEFIKSVLILSYRKSNSKASPQKLYAEFLIKNKKNNECLVYFEQLN